MRRANDLPDPRTPEQPLRFAVHKEPLQDYAPVRSGEPDFPRHAGDIEAIVTSMAHDIDALLAMMADLLRVRLTGAPGGYDYFVSEVLVDGPHAPEGAYLRARMAAMLRHHSSAGGRQYRTRALFRHGLTEEKQFSSEFGMSEEQVAKYVDQRAYVQSLT